MIDHRRREWLCLNRDNAVVNCADWIWVIKINKRIHFSEEHRITRGLNFRGINDHLRTKRRVRQNPRRNLDILVVAVTGSVALRRHEKIKNGRGRFNDRISGVIKRGNGDALVAASQWVSRVNIGIAGDTESSSVGLAHDDGRGLFTNLAHPDALVAGSEFISAVNFGVAVETEESRVGSAVDGGCGGLAGVAWFSDHAPASSEALDNIWSQVKSHG